MEDIDRNRFKEIRRRSIMGIQVWLDMLVASQKGDIEECKRLYGEARTSTIETADFLRAIGSEGQKHERVPEVQPADHPR